MHGNVFYLCSPLPRHLKSEDPNGRVDRGAVPFRFSLGNGGAGVYVPTVPRCIDPAKFNAGPAWTDTTTKNKQPTYATLRAGESCGGCDLKG